jgi:hypothetical protein
MGLIKWLIGDLTIKTCGDKIGYLFNNSIFNVTTSGVGVCLTGASCAKSVCKGIMSPIPWCKALYFTSATLNGVSCTASGLCLLSGYSCLGPLPILTGSVAYATSVGARACNAIGDCMNPAAGLTSKAADTCIDLATKGLS